MLMSSQAARRYFTVDEYHRMGEAGILREDDRVELIEGEILKMSPVGSRHAACVKRLNEQLSKLLTSRALIGIQDPILLNDSSEPQPDLTVLRRRDDFYATAHPNAADVLLLVEVADTSITYDREGKLPIYARSAIPEVWIVNLSAEVVETYAQPVRGSYKDSRTFRRGESITPLKFSDIAIPVAGILG
jgi:Uma2 family endonuclease